jgi:hypothetical protein
MQSYRTAVGVGAGEPVPFLHSYDPGTTAWITLCGFCLREVLAEMQGLVSVFVADRCRADEHNEAGKNCYCTGTGDAPGTLNPNVSALPLTSVSRRAS